MLILSGIFPGALPLAFHAKTYLALLLFPVLFHSLGKEKRSPVTSEVFREEYDFIVAGGGSGGATVAARLSELSCASVLLLEAGGHAEVQSDVPALARNLWFTELDWKYKTVPQKNTGAGLVNRQVVWPKGKGLGGSSLINAMLYIRGNRKNYDDWGVEGWSYKDVHPYFLKAEGNTDPEYLANGHHNGSGPLTVETNVYKSEIQDPIFEAALKLGYKLTDPNGDTQTGFLNPQITTRNHQRCSTAKAYLVPAERRSNLDILTHAHVRKVLLENNQAKGVEFDWGVARRTVRARREVILSAGTVNSAQILMLSGIGPKEHLKKHKIPVIADLPVGENLQDHCAGVVNFALNADIPNQYSEMSDPANILQYLHNRTGVYASPQFIPAMAFVRGLDVTPDTDFPTAELYFDKATRFEPARTEFGLNKEYYHKVYESYKNDSLVVCLAQILQPKSRGTVRLNSADPYDPPLIDPNYYDHPDDLKAVVEGMQVCQRIGGSDAMKKVGGRPFGPWPGCEEFASDEYKALECQAKFLAVTLNHEVGTVKMGRPEDPSTVVDPELRVKGIKGLRVVDASVMPLVPSGNTNAPTIMIGEKAADIIKKTVHC